MSTVQVIEKDGQFTALDEETGTAVRGRTKSLALLSLAVALHSVGDDIDSQATTNGDTETNVKEFEELCEDVQRRFEQHDVSEEDVEDAIEWARQR